MYKIAIIFLFSISSMVSWAQMRWNQTYQLYINQYKDLAIREMLQYRIPASITLAQAVFESGAGRSRLAMLGNNHFGIKCHDWTGRTIAEDDDALGECFRAYDHPLQSFEDHSKFLVNSSRYRRLFSLSMEDYRGWAHGLKACGYATNPRYAHKLIELIELYKLYVYDGATSYDHAMVEYSGNQTVVNQAKPLHPIAIFNKNYYIRARRGDTFKLIGEEIGVSYRKIAKYNERDKDDTLTEGEIIFLKKKRKKAPKAFKNRPHVVKDGESLYIIAQIYGMRLSSLYKLNDFTPDHTIHVGDVVRVY
ncbi:glucosaminidase domain-containing protein [Hoylesella buccalis]|uniref:Peptidoglycan hydrolase n=1 Tax=Hoylesella buccalis DNF00853 TaxID=1401074 RepID=A0A096BLV0_9BACT|nr:N-acetylmuramoyl-L-alanine amidase [Hoylesella buccalis DNF00853]